MKNSTSPKTAIKEHFLRGESLSVGIAWRLYHTSELRKAVSRLNKEFMTIGKQIIGEYLDGNDFKTYKLVDGI